MTAEQVIRAVEESGGWFELQQGESILVRRAPKKLVPALRILKPEIIRLLRQVVPEMPVVIYLDACCNCREKPYPHLRHRDGSGPGSGHKLDGKL